MKVAVLNRTSSGDEGTFGRLLCEDGLKLYSGELPWRDNQKGLSCIPPNAYVCQWLLSPTHGWCYHVMGVPGRSELEIHSANFCGDRMLGKLCELRGCITLGLSVGKLKEQTAILQSHKAIEQLVEHMKRETFQLIVNAVAGS